MSSNNRDFATVQVNVFDVNDHFPMFEVPLYEAGVEENEEVNYLVVTVMASDNDEVRTSCRTIV